MSGFFGVRTSVAQAIVRDHGHAFERGGFKVLMDLLLHAPADLRVGEVPYVFLPRHAGESKLTRRHYLSFLRQLGRGGRMAASFFEALMSGLLLRFALVGATGILVNEGLLFLLHEGAAAPLVLASAIAIEASILWNFALNDAWTFRGKGANPAWVRFTRFHAASALGMVLNVAVVVAGAALLPGVSYLLANLVGIAAGSAANFLLNLHWTWGVPAEDAPGEARS
jgi:dolichol-phosphate mannosyltransferase